MHKLSYGKRINFKLWIIFVLFFRINNASATIFVVSNTNDTGPGSLRDNINLAIDYDTITFDGSINGVPVILNSEIEISKVISIYGYSTLNTIIDGNNANRIFNVTSSGNLMMYNLALSHGSSASHGGAIYSEGPCNFGSCLFENNHANLSGGFLYATADIFMDRCTIRNNIALGSGGGMYTSGNGYIEFSTLYNNEADDAGGAIFCSGVTQIVLSTISGNNVIAKGGGIYNEGDLEIRNSTIAYNSSAQVGGGINNEAGTLYMFNTLFVENTASGLGGDGYNNSGAIIDPLSDFNLFSTNSGFGVGTGLNNQLDVDAAVGPLTYNYNGFTETHLLICGSHGINEGHANFPVTFDQNGIVRDSFPDIGACEYIPTTLYVTNSNDSGTGSLREMISRACSNDTIRFDPVTIGYPILLASELLIDKKIFIKGNGTGQTVISGNNITRIFSISQLGNLYLSELDLTEGFVAGASGGAINNGGELQISRCNLYNNICEDYGGAITTTGVLVIDNSNFSYNQSTVSSGGAIYSDGGHITMTNSTLNGNYAFIFGGGMFVNDTTIISNCTISENSCNTALGGGITNAGFLSLTNSTVTLNSDGVWSDSGILFFVNTLIAGNSGLNIRNDGTIDLSSRNNAIGDASVSGMPAGNQNYYNVIPDLGPLGDYGGYTLTHSLRCNNIYCTDRADVSSAPATDQRGVIRSTSYSDIGAFENQLQNSYQVINTNDSGPGSLREAMANSCDIAFIEFHPSLDGDTIFLNSPIDVIVHAYIYGRGTQNTIISGNLITRIFNVWSADTLELSNLVLTNGNSGIYNGGCIHNDGCIEAQNVKFVNNQCNGTGGAIHNNFVLHINQSTFESNKANGSSGGAIFQTINAQTLLVQCTLDSNYAAGSGGAVCGDINTVLENCTFSSNHSDANGGAVNMTGFSDLISCTLTSNSADGNGGGLNIESGATVYLKNTIIAGNTAIVNGPDGNNSGSINSISMNNLIGDNSDFNMPVGQGNILDQAALLDDLADNGGETFTHALQCGSPAINSASTQFPYQTDQRDSARVGLPDIGAFEFSDINVEINLGNDTLYAVQQGAVYQWLDCNTNTTISGQSSSFFAPIANGSYAMIISNNGCTDTSDCVNITSVGIDDRNFIDSIELYPNPVRLELKINATSSQIESVEILNLAGQILQCKMKGDTHELYFDMSELPAGIYIAKIKLSEFITRLKFVKQ